MIEQLYKLRSNFIVIGLTGRTGSGCSTVGNLLSKKLYKEFNAPEPEKGNNISNDSRKYRITYNYLDSSNNWKKFTVIKASDVITFFVVSYSYQIFLNYLRKERNDSSLSFSDEFEKNYNEIHEKAKRVINFIKKKTYRIDLSEIFANMSDKTITNIKISSDRLELLKSKLKEEHKKEFEFVLNFLFNDLDIFSAKLKKQLYKNQKNKSFSEYQKWGDNIRMHGRALNSTETIFKNDTNTLSTLADCINSIIKILRVYNSKFNENENEITRVVIDALRNPYEILFFRERYSAFYTISINTEEEERRSRLFRIGFNEESINNLDIKEYPDKDIFKDTYAKQHIQKCIELSDIHIVNPNDGGEDKAYLKRQLVHYISLMTHPGIVPPTPVERSMQIAYTAKLNSGCISRQVGAAITDEKFSLKSIGWNNTPEGQTPCSMRNLDDILESNDKNAYSKYELSDVKFRETLLVIKKGIDKKGDYKANLKGRNLSYCFKDIQNLTEGKKNQVHTRSLHAEENAFLQIAKYGGIGLKNGKLFTTASPCELCAKKAYQIGIKEIYFIDPYPGISLRHILNCGTQQPLLKLFEGAIGRAYFHLYHPILMHKDEISELLQFSVNSLSKKQ